MLRTTLAAESYVAELFEQNEVQTIFYEALEEEKLNELLNNDELTFFKESLDSFIEEVVNFVKANPSIFISESKEETIERIYTFATHAIKGYLEELAELEAIIPNLTESVLSEEEDEEAAEDIIATEIAELNERAKLYGLTKGLGSLSYLDEISKKKLAIAGGLAGLAGLAGTVYAAKKMLDDESMFSKLGRTFRHITGHETLRDKFLNVAERIRDKIQG